MKKIYSLFLLAIVILLAGCHSTPTKPKNIIYLIGDGMGVAQVTAAMHANGNQLHMERCSHVGLVKTFSASNYITDSAAGGTALACGQKTNNGVVGLDVDSLRIESILELAGRNGLSTGVVVTSEVTHATPASFAAHQVSRTLNQEIAADFLANPYLNLFIGGGRRHFENRADGRNLIAELEAKGYTIASTVAECLAVKEGKLAGFLFEEGWSESIRGGHLPAMPMRGPIHADATMAAIEILNNNKQGFFLMVEGSQIDWGGHENNLEYVLAETLDFDAVVGKVLDYAQQDGNTLVVITADHETGGLTLAYGSDPKGYDARFTTDGHTACMVPLFAYGPGAEEFTGVMDNTAIKTKMAKLLGLQ